MVPSMVMPDTLFEVFPLKTVLCLLWAVSKASAEFHKLGVVASLEPSVQYHISPPTEEIERSHFMSASCGSVPFSTLAMTPVTPPLFIPA